MDTSQSASELVWKEPSKSAVKKAESVLERFRKKLEKQQSAEEEQRMQRLEELEKAKSIIVKEDPSLPKATRITIGCKDVELGDEDKKGARVKDCGRIHRLRSQKHATFITLADGYDHLQCVLEAGNLKKSRDALLFAQVTSLVMYGDFTQSSQLYLETDREILPRREKPHSPSSGRIHTSKRRWISSNSPTYSITSRRLFVPLMSRRISIHITC